MIVHLGRLLINVICKPDEVMNSFFLITRMLDLKKERKTKKKEKEQKVNVQIPRTNYSVYRSAILLLMARPSLDGSINFRRWKKITPTRSIYCADTYSKFF